MCDAPRDDRLISGAVICAQLWFDVGAPMLTMSSSLNHDRGGHAIHHDLTVLHDIRLGGPAGSLKRQSGRLSLFDGREQALRVGQLAAEPPDHYSLWLNLSADEFDTAWQLLLAGYRLARVEVEFDNEVEQKVDTAHYWDDVRYPVVEVDSYRLDWVAEAGVGLARRHNMFGIKRADQS